MMYKILGIVLIWTGFICTYFRDNIITNNTAIIGDRGDNLFVLSILNYQWKTVFARPAHIFDLPIYFPSKNTAFMSDIDLTFTFIYGIILTILGQEIQSFNLLIIVLITGSFFGTAYLVYDFTKSVPGALGSALLFSFSPVVIAQVGHVNLLATWCIPAIIIALNKILRKRNIYSIIPVITVVTIQLYTGIYLAIQCIIAGFIFICAHLYFYEYLNIVSFFRFIAIGIVCVTIICLPVISGYWYISNEHNIIRNIDENILYSAEPASYLLGDGADYLASPFSSSAMMKESHEKRLWPGWVSLSLSFAAVVISVVNYKRLIITDKILLLTSGVIIIFGVIASLGPHLVIEGTDSRIILPYILLLKFVPGFNALRVPARFGILAAFGLALLAGFAISKVPCSGRLRVRREVIQYGLVFVIGMVCLARRPIPTDNIEDVLRSPAVSLLSQGLDGPVVWYPIHAAMAKPWKEVPRMFINRGLTPFVNGYSGMVPVGVFDIRRLMDSEDASVASSVLFNLGVRHVLFDVTDTPSKMLNDWKGLESGGGGLCKTSGRSFPSGLSAQRSLQARSRFRLTTASSFRRFQQH